MAIIKPERYTEDLKAYLTYPPDKKITPRLLEETYEKWWKVSFQNTSVIGERLPAALMNELKAMGAKVERERKLRLKGKKELFGVSVEIRKIIDHGALKAIRVRVTGKNIDELNRNKNTIIAGLASYGVVYTECIWVGIAGGPSKKEIKQKAALPHEKEIRKLTNVVEDLRDEVESLKKPATRGRVHEDRAATAGILH